MFHTSFSAPRIDPRWAPGAWGLWGPRWSCHAEALEAAASVSLPLTCASCNLPLGDPGSTDRQNTLMKKNSFNIDTWYVHIILYIIIYHDVISTYIYIYTRIYIYIYTYIYIYMNTHTDAYIDVYTYGTIKHTNVSKIMQASNPQGLQLHKAHPVQRCNSRN